MNIPNKNKLGDCFVQAYNNCNRYIEEQPLLVHGVVVGRGPIEGIEYTHAWIEIGENVIDTTMPLFAKGFPREIYYSLAQANKQLMFKYTRDEVLKKVLEFGTYGPWEEELNNYS